MGGGRDEEVASSKKKTELKTKVQYQYPIYDQAAKWLKSISNI